MADTPVELVTGALGTPHIDGDDWGALNKSILGPDCYVLKEGDAALACSMQDANKAVVPALEASMYGRHARVKSPQTVTIQSGTQGQKRNDLIVLRYTRAADGTEKATLEPIKGTPTTGTAADPTANPGPITSGASALTVDMPLWRIPLDGITVGTPVPLFSVLAPMSELWDSVTPTVLFDNPSAAVGNKVTTPQPIINFKRLFIQFRNPDNIYGSVTLEDPNGKWVALSTTTVTQSSSTGTRMYHHMRVVDCSGSTIQTKYNSGYLRGQWSNEYGTDKPNTDAEVIAITKVIGWNSGLTMLSN